MARGAGSLDRRVTFQRFQESQDDFGAPARSWAVLFVRWASRSDVSDGERHAAGETGAALVARFVVRSDSETRTITAKDRISHDGSIWEIHGVKETKEGRGRFIELTTAVRIDG